MSSTAVFMPDNPPSPSREHEIFIRLAGNRLIVTDDTGLLGIHPDLATKCATSPRRKSKKTAVKPAISRGNRTIDRTIEGSPLQRGCGSN